MRRPYTILLICCAMSVLYFSLQPLVCTGEKARESEGSWRTGKRWRFLSRYY